MTVFAIALLLACSAALLAAPRRFACLPLLIGTCYIPLAQGIEIGSFTFSFIRVLILVGFARVLARGEKLMGGLNKLDGLMLIWGGWAIVSSFFHKEPTSELIYRLGLVWNCCGVYFLLRLFCQSFEDLVTLSALTAILLVPVALEMVYEVKTQHNLFSIFGASDSPAVREGRIRAQGPFAHAILAGTVGAVCLPFMIGLWRLHRKKALIGIGACLTIVVASASSGPIMSAAASMAALCMWRYRHRLRLVRWMMVFAYIGLDIVMKAPAYYIISRIDLTGGSTGFYRAALIESALYYLNEWWLVGTDYTRHWMPTGVSWSQDHTDITNHYIYMGVMGGLLLMFLFIFVLAKGFGFVGQAVREGTVLQPERRFLLWSLGASLFSHTATFVSVSYFDQSFVFLYLTLGAIGSMRAVTTQEVQVVQEEEAILEQAAPAQEVPPWGEEEHPGLLR